MKASVIATIVAAICLALLSLPANATSTRTWVSGTGLDTNPCSRTQPCLTFAGALSRTAAGGEIDCLDPGGFGSVTINMALTIKCDPNSNGGLAAAAANAINIAAGANDVVYLEGLDINGFGVGPTGISFTSGKALHVSNCVIHGFTAVGINFAPSSSTGLLVVQDSKVVDNAAGGILIAPTGGILVTAKITNTHMDRNQFGLKVKDFGLATVSNSTAASNTNHGFIAASAGSGAANIVVSHSLSFGNGVSGIAASGFASATVFDVSMYNNGNANANNNGFFTAGGGTIYTTSPATNLNTGTGAPGGNAYVLQ